MDVLFENSQEIDVAGITVDFPPNLRNVIHLMSA